MTFYVLFGTREVLGRHEFTTCPSREVALLEAADWSDVHVYEVVRCQDDRQAIAVLLAWLYKRDEHWKGVTEITPPSRDTALKHSQGVHTRCDRETCDWWKNQAAAR